MGERAVVRDCESMIYRRTTQLWGFQGTYQIVVHAILDLEDPTDEIILLTLEVTSVLGVLDGAKDAKHTCGCPTITCACAKPDEDRTD